MPRAATPFDERVDRSGEHHLWGARKQNGMGQIRVGGRLFTAAHVAWKRAHGPVPDGMRVKGCEVAACVRPEHLSLETLPRSTSRRRRAPRGSGSKRQIRPGVWKLSVSAGRYEDGSIRRLHRTIHTTSEATATRELQAFVADVRGSAPAKTRKDRDTCVDDAIEQFLTEHLLGEKGREQRTINDYRRLHLKWFAPEIGRRRVGDVDEATIDRIFGRMRRAGLSRSRMNHARSLYAPFFRWAKRRHLITRSPMADFQLPTSTYVAREHTPPEVEQLSLLLEAAVDVVPDIAALLTLGAVTGMRRGELVTVRRSRVRAEQGVLVVDAASDGKRVKPTKTRTERTVAIDSATVQMLQRHCALMDERAYLCGLEIGPDAFIFSLALDCSTPMPPDHVTKRVALLKEHLGIANKRPETIALEDDALRLARAHTSYAAIGRQLGRSDRWAKMAVTSAERREAADMRGTNTHATFDGSILALRKFTSSELLDAGFNVSMVAQRQGHGPQVLIKHYAKSRVTADRKAAEHLGRVVHQQ
jgi:integrase